MSCVDNRPIGVFDSGIGGLTVVKEIIKTLPNESIIYLGDTARVPYGTRDDEIITKFALELADYLLKKNVKVLVVACNTISATCFEEIERISPVPVIGVIKPAAKWAASSTSKRTIGVIGTRATMRSGAYTRAIKDIKPGMEVLHKACPLFVPVVEEGLANHEIAEMVVREYLENEFDGEVDTLILGCTHYPILKDTIRKVLNGIKLIDSAKPTAQELKEILKNKELLNYEGAEYQILLTDTPPHIQNVIDLFFEGKSPAKLNKVAL